MSICIKYLNCLCISELEQCDKFDGNMWFWKHNKNGNGSSARVPVCSYAGQLYIAILHVHRLRASVSPSGVCFRYKGLDWTVTSVIISDSVFDMKEYYLCSLNVKEVLNSDMYLLTSETWFGLLLECISEIDCIYVLWIFPHWVASSLLRKFFLRYCCLAWVPCRFCSESTGPRSWCRCHALSLHICIHVVVYVFGLLRLLCNYVSECDFKSVVII